MPMALARQRCPQAIVVPPRFERYAEVSAQLMAVFEDFSPTVEPISLDEAFLDMSGSGHHFGTPSQMGARIKAAVREATGGLTVSVGIAVNKFVAKVASGHDKPDGLTIVAPGESAAWLAALPVSVLWGAGPKTQRRLNALGLDTVGDVASCDPERLEAALGRMGRQFSALARGEDAREVVGSRAAKSIGSERTLERDLEGREAIALQLRKAAEQVGRRLRRGGMMAGGVRVKLKRRDFTILTRQRSLRVPSSGNEMLRAAAVDLLPEFGDVGPVRLVGLTAYDLQPVDAQTQLELVTNASQRERQLDGLLDAVQQRFGPGTLHRARELTRTEVIDGGVTLDELRRMKRDAGEGGSED
jgi:DNA polymerase-4